MLFLLDSGKLAVQCGKWRGLLYFAASPVFLCFAWAIPSVLEVITSMSPAGATAMPEWAYYASLGFLAAAFLLWVAGLWRLYRDHVHGDYYHDAEHYKTHGW